MMSSVMINGRRISVPNGSSVSINNGEIFVNGEKYEDDKLKYKEIVHLIVNGDVGSIVSDVSVEINGNVDGDIDAGTSVKVNGNMIGDIDSGTSTTVYGNQTGKIEAGTSIKIGNRK